MVAVAVRAHTRDRQGSGCYGDRPSSLERSPPTGLMMLGDVCCNTRLESRVYCPTQPPPTPPHRPTLTRAGVQWKSSAIESSSLFVPPFTG